MNKSQENGLEQEFDELREPEEEPLEEVLTSIKRSLCSKTGLGRDGDFSFPVARPSVFTEEEIFDLTEDMRLETPNMPQISGEELFNLIRPSLENWLKNRH